ncbi:UDP-glycosyltransferase 86A1 [Carex littledalei]|uniref:Glycosyltransferase n=1 Tax=Carex littledalei TaxID=544730 RepID=A0A833R0T8_9POAL|nr:UDP-glycosyltransferase 86A1 [Carex littledalei]
MAKPRPHAVVMAYPLQGHIIPAVHLALRLAARGVTVTFINTEAVHHQTIKAAGADCRDRYDPFSSARQSGLDIRYETVSDGLPLSFDRSLNHDQFMYSLLHVLSAHVEELLRRLGATTDPPITCLISDTFFVWPATIGEKLGLPYISFWTEPALIFTLYSHMDLLRKNGHFSCRENRKDAITYIPGVPSIEPKELMSYLQDTDVSSVVHQIISKAFDEAKRAKIILCNTVEELEPGTVAALKLEKPFYSIGPIFPTGFTRSTVATSLWAESDCINWLNTKEPRSVLYISFGSYAHVSKKDLCEIAQGIMNSKVNFIWVLRPDVVSSDELDPLPLGFVEETKGRGIVVQWCCQVEVLSHPAVGGFLTHCGWNSVLESVWCGVPMLCFPLLTDQFTNRKLVVRDWQIGLAIGELNEVAADDVAGLVKDLMQGKKGEQARYEIKNVRKILQDASEIKGSSQKNFDQFILDITK